MRRVIFASLLGIQAIALGQTVSLTIGSASGVPGGTVDLPVILSGGAAPAGLQWNFSYSSDITLVSVAAGGSTTAGGKTLNCSGNTCLAFGFNTTTFGDGIVAVATFQIAANPSTTSIGVIVNGVVASTVAGTPIPASGGAGVITLPAAVGLSAVGCTTTTLNTPTSTGCTVSLTGAAPAGGFAVPLSSNNASLTVPASVTVGAGLTTAGFHCKCCSGKYEPERSGNG